MSDMHELEALVAFGKVGLKMMAARILSMMALLGLLLIGAFVAYSPTWPGVVVVGMIGLCFTAAARLEAGRQAAPAKTTEA